MHTQCKRIKTTQVRLLQLQPQSLLSSCYYSIITCTARVTVVDNSVCLSVCLFVCLSVRLYRLNLGNGKLHGKQPCVMTINHE